MISFTAPWVLAGLAAVAIPLILHLVARREPPLVAFPAVRYLEDTARRHQRRFQLQHWLLLLVRMALIAALVLAAAGPTLAGAGSGGHAPAALVLVIDNSLSSAAIVGGTAVLEQFRQPALRILAQAGAGDRVWLLTADGIPRAGDPAALRDQVEQLAPVPLRMDLGAALAAGHELLGSTELPGELIVLTDLQASAVTGGDGHQTIVGVPAGDPPDNRGLAGVVTGPQPWGSSGRITAAVIGSTPQSAAMTITIDGKTLSQLLVPPGGSGTATLTSLSAGWHEAIVEINPDELRLDDQVRVGIRVAPPVAASWPSDNSYLAEASQVLLENGRLSRGAEVMLDRLGGGASIVFPPEDPAALGALNRALLSRGATWQFAERLSDATTIDSTPLLGPLPVMLRHRLQPIGGGSGEVLLTAGGEPWMVRTGRVILVGSRFDPAWTSLPLAAAFMPFMDLLLNRLARGEMARLVTAPGNPVRLPDRVTAIAFAGVEQRVEGGAPWQPSSPGLHWLLAGGDTVGVLESNHDPRESDLARVPPATIASLWSGVELATPAAAAELAFTRAARADLRGPLLWLAAGLAGAELILGGIGRRRR